jgi:pimeloyl-ACP methyl ester carboxylesterase
LHAHRRGRRAAVPWPNGRSADREASPAGLIDPRWHGKSPPPEGAIQGSWRLNTDLYVALIMGFVGAARLEKPVALGASMSGEICLELAYRHPEAFAGIIPCEACD